MRKDLAVVILLLVAIAVLLGIQLFNQPSDTWSYIILAPTDENLIKELNKFGAVGWEVVSARRATGSEGSASKPAYEMILKRHGATLGLVNEWTPSK